MPPDDSVDLHPGAVLHIKNFSTRGHPQKNKYLLVIGCLGETEVLGFLIYSQLNYLQLPSQKREVVRIASYVTPFLHCESIIQCFELERLSRTALCEGYECGAIENEGRLPVRFLHLIRETVRASFLLTQEAIDIALKVLPPAS